MPVGALAGSDWMLALPTFPTSVPSWACSVPNDPVSQQTEL